MAEAMLQLDASVLDPVFDGSSLPVFDPQRELPVPGIVVAGDPVSPDTIVRESRERVRAAQLSSKLPWPHHRGCERLRGRRRDLARSRQR